MITIEENTFEEAFKSINRAFIENKTILVDSRIGTCSEIINLNYKVKDTSSYVFSDPRINRINYEYADVFYNFMMSGQTNAKEAFKDYAHTHKFFEKTSSVPENFNTLYGPRIKAQLPSLIKELSLNENSRRANILILSSEDQFLLDLNETIEYPCTIGATYFIRFGKLHTHLMMRSQNMAVVLQLDMYLMGRLSCHIAQMLGVKVGEFYSSVSSAHVFSRDDEYVQSFL